MRRASGSETERVMAGMARMNPGSNAGRSALVAPPTRPNRGKQKQGGPELLIAASDALDREKDAAWRVCDGVSDQNEINEAAEFVGSWGGAVFLSSGTFHDDGAILLPSYCELSAVARDGTYVLASGCNALEVADVATIRAISFQNADDSLGTAGIRAESAEDVQWITGIIEDCYFLNFEKQIHLLDGQWWIERNVMWNLLAGATPWGIYVDDPGGSPGLNNGENMILNNRMIRGHGIYLGGTSAHPHHLRGNRLGSASTETALEIAAGSHQNLITENDFDSGKVIVRGNRNRLALNHYGNEWTIEGDDNTLHDNDGRPALTIAATADFTRHWGNDWNAVTDNGTNTKKNLDGSANDWNF